MKEKRYEIMKNLVISLSIFFFLVAIDLMVSKNQSFDVYQSLEYEYINIKDMTVNAVSIKSQNKGFSLWVEETNAQEENSFVVNKLTPVDFVSVRKPEEKKEVRRIWYLPTEQGVISQYPRYGHVAYDITSPRGSGEVIFPVANGVVSSIYRDYAGALIVTVYHNINGVPYTSQYVHLSRYAEGLYVGKEVTIHDALGYMGNTGRSYGTHLHFALLNCSLYDPNDYNCSDLNGFFRFANYRYQEGFYGLGNVMSMPHEWYSR